MDRGCGTLVCRLLGGIDFAVDDEPVALRGRQRRRLAAVLMASAPRPVGTDELIEVLQAEAEDTSTADPANAVHAHVRRLRALIEPGVTPAESFRLTWGPAGYSLVADDVDLWRYHAAVAAAEEWRQTDQRKAVAAYEQALALWNSPFGDLESDEALSPYAEPITSAHLNHVDACNDVRLNLGAAGEVADEIVAGARARPVREHRWAQAMQALFQANRQAEALRLYIEARQLLLSELGLDPGPELRQMEQQVLRQDPVLLGRSRRAPVRPVPATTFVGRRDEIERLDELLGRHRLVTVVGLGGTGKTRLVLEWLARSPTAASVRWTDLRGIDDDRTARHRIAADLGVATSGEEALDPIELVAATLEDSTRLVVVDNAESSIETVRDLISRVSEELPDVRFVTMSRVPIGLTSEVLLPLAGLPVPVDGADIEGTAVELVLDRLGSNADEAVARKLAERFGGLPYPLELVAAAHDSEDELDRAVEVRTADAAIAEAVDVALDHVSDDAIEVLWSTLLMPDGVSGALLDATHRPVVADFARRHRDRLLRELVSASLLTTCAGPAGTRYRGSEPLVEIGGARLDDAAATARLVAAAKWWSTRTRSSYFEPPSPAGIAVLAADHRNIVYVLGRLKEANPEDSLALAAHMIDHWERSDHTAEGAEWIRSTLDRVENGTPIHSLGVAALVASSGGVAMNARHQPILEETRAAMIAAGDADGDIWAVIQLQLAIARGWNGDLEGSDEAFAEAAAQAVKASSDWYAAVLQRFGALRFALTGDPLTGCAQAAAAADLFDDLDDPDSAAGSLYFASVLGRMGGADDLSEVLARARRYAEESRSLQLRALIVIKQGQDACRRGDAEAPQLLAEGAALTERVGNLRTGSITRRDLGLYLIGVGRTDEAAAQLIRSCRHLLRLDTRSAALALGGLSVLATSAPPIADALAATAWATAAADSGVPLSDADQAILAQLIGAPTGAPSQDPETLLADAAELLRVPGRVESGI